MKSSRFQKHLFRLEKEVDDTTVTDIGNFFRLKKENKAIKNRIIRDIRSIFEHKEEDYYKLVKVGSFWSNNYIEYESNGNRNKILLAEEYLYRIRLYSKDIINHLKKSNTWKIQLSMTTNFISSKGNDKERVMHSKSNNIEIIVNDKVVEVKNFESLPSRYQIGSETSMRGSGLIFDYVHLLYYKCHKINFK